MITFRAKSNFLENSPIFVVFFKGVGLFVQNKRSVGRDYRLYIDYRVHSILLKYDKCW